MIIIKPDAFKRQLVGRILSRFEPHLRYMYTKQMTVADCEAHYGEHIGAPYYENLVKHMTSDISLLASLNMPWEKAREIALQIRREHFIEGPKNLIHASDSYEWNQRETEYWELV